MLLTYANPQEKQAQRLTPLGFACFVAIVFILIYPSAACAKFVHVLDARLISNAEAVAEYHQVIEDATSRGGRSLRLTLILKVDSNQGLNLGELVLPDSVRVARITTRILVYNGKRLRKRININAITLDADQAYRLNLEVIS